MTEGKESINNLRLFDYYYDLKFYEIDCPKQCVCGNPHNFILFIHQFHS